VKKKREKYGGGGIGKLATKIKKRKINLLRNLKINFVNSP